MTRLSKRLAGVWGTVRATTGDKATLISKYKSELAPDKLAAANLSHGRTVFSKTCAQCHTLFDAGGKLGPNLTGGPASGAGLHPRKPSSIQTLRWPKSSR
jgi:cytochrome c2